MSNKTEPTSLIDEIISKHNETTVKGEKPDKITIKDAIIIGEYLTNGFNQTKAYIKAYPKTPYDSARAISPRFFAKVSTKNIVKTYLDSVIDQYKNTLHYDIIATYKARAFYEVSDILDDKGNLREDLSKYNRKVVDGVKQRVMKTGSGADEKIHYIREYQLADRDKALSMLTDYMKLLPKESINLSIDTKEVDKLKELFDK